MASVTTSDPGAPLPFRLLLWKTLSLYKRALLPYMAVAMAGGLVSTALAFALPVPGDLFVLIFWGITVQVPVFIAEAALIILAVRVQEGKKPEIAAAYLSVIPVAIPYIIGRILVEVSLVLAFGAIVSGSLYLAVLIAGPSFFLFARFSLFGPFILVGPGSNLQDGVKETSWLGVAGSLRKSWALVRGRTLRTLTMFLMLLVPLIFIEALLQRLMVEPSSESLVALVSLSIAMQAIAAPIIRLFTLLLYQDYLRLTLQRLSTTNE